MHKYTLSIHYEEDPEPGGGQYDTLSEALDAICGTVKTGRVRELFLYELTPAIVFHYKTPERHQP